MIIDNLYSTQCDYGNMDGRLARAFAWLRSTDLKSLKPDQAIPVEDRRIVAMIQSYQTINPIDAAFETHRAFIDIQVVASGSEIMYWTPAAKLAKVKTPYNYEKDMILFEEPDFSVPMPFHEGDFAVFFPSDGHKARCRLGEAAKVGKIVVKVAV